MSKKRMQVEQQMEPLRPAPLKTMCYLDTLAFLKQKLTLTEAALVSLATALPSYRLSTPPQDVSYCALYGSPSSAMESIRWMKHLMGADPGFEYESLMLSLDCTLIAEWQCSEMQHSASIVQLLREIRSRCHDDPPYILLVLKSVERACASLITLLQRTDYLSSLVQGTRMIVLCEAAYTGREADFQESLQMGSEFVTSQVMSMMRALGWTEPRPDKNVLCYNPLTSKLAFESRLTQALLAWKASAFPNTPPLHHSKILGLIREALTISNWTFEGARKHLIQAAQFDHPPPPTERDAKLSHATVPTSQETLRLQRTRLHCWESVFELGSTTAPCPCCRTTTIELDSFKPVRIVALCQSTPLNYIPVCAQCAGRSAEEANLVDWMGTDGHRKKLLRSLMLAKYKSDVAPAKRSRDQPGQLATWVAQWYGPLKQLHQYADWLILLPEELTRIQRDD